MVFHSSSMVVLYCNGVVKDCAALTVKVIHSCSAGCVCPRCNGATSFALAYLELENYESSNSSLWYILITFWLIEHVVNSQPEHKSYYYALNLICILRLFTANLEHAIQTWVGNLVLVLFTIISYRTFYGTKIEFTR